MNNPPLPTSNHHGFTLIEIAIVMVIIGLLTGAGMSLMSMLTKRKARNETVDYLKEVKGALISYANIKGRLPWADTDGDGNENSGATSGDLPYSTLGVRPKDSYIRTLTYALNTNLGTDRGITCGALRTGLSGNPLVVDADGASTSFSIAAIIISAGPMDADSDGNVFDDIISGPYQGDNTDGNPNYIRHPPTDTFDDLVLYIGGNELYGEICEYLDLAVNNNSGSTVYVYNQSQGSDIGSIGSPGTGSFNIISGTEIRICPTSGGCLPSSTVPSTPPTPITLAGKGCTITIP
jgi:prepilin-type N-terminal cleavage/methylation domain-containing protein